MPMVPDPLCDLQLGTSQHVIANATLAVVRVSGVAAFAIEHGCRVLVEPDTAGEAILVEAHLYGTVAALLLGQRGRLALHATTVEIDGVTVAIAGHSTAGKSTAGLELAARGHRLMADDVSALDNDGGEIVVTPFGRPVHVWPETLVALGTSPRVLPHLPDSGKLVLPPPIAETAALQALVVLCPDAEAHEVAIETLSPSDALAWVAAHLYRGALVGEVWPEVTFRWLAAVASAIPVGVLRRPTTGWSVPAVADAIEAHTARTVPVTP